MRTTIPGVQVALAFLLTVPFSSRFLELDEPGMAMVSALLVVVRLIFRTPAGFAVAGTVLAALLGAWVVLPTLMGRMRQGRDSPPIHRRTKVTPENSARDTEAVVLDHLALREQGDVEGDFEHNYQPDVVLLTGLGTFSEHARAVAAGDRDAPPHRLGDHPAAARRR